MQCISSVGKIFNWYILVPLISRSTKRDADWGLHSSADLSAHTNLGPRFESHAHHLDFCHVKSNFVLYFSFNFEIEFIDSKSLHKWCFFLKISFARTYIDPFQKSIRPNHEYAT